MNIFSHYKILFIVAGVVIAAVISIAGLIISQPPKGIPVLNYHVVENNSNNPIAISIEDFDRQMTFLHQHGYTCITPDQLLTSIQTNIPLPDKSVLITFDDGYQNVYTNAFPILKKYGFTATVFIVTDVVGNDKWYLTWEQVKEMREAGLVFGSHTLSHVDLTSVFPAEALFQLEKSKDGIEWRLKTPVTYLAYPGGAYNRQIIDLVRQAGYKAAFTVDFGRVGEASDIYALERIPILKSRFTFYEFCLRLQFTPLAEKVKDIRKLFHSTTKKPPL